MWPCKIKFEGINAPGLLAVADSVPRDSLTIHFWPGCCPNVDPHLTYSIYHPIHELHIIMLLHAATCTYCTDWCIIHLLIIEGIYIVYIYLHVSYVYHIYIIIYNIYIWSTDYPNLSRYKFTSYPVPWLGLTGTGRLGTSPSQSWPDSWGQKILLSVPNRRLVKDMIGLYWIYHDLSW
jgi:hypothetical protein